MNNKPAPKAAALLPIAVFLVLYLGLGILFEYVLKIDMGFLRKSENEVKGQDILESIITLAGKIGMDVITEGVETKKQLDMLTMMGCHEFQGYYFSKPVPVSEFEEKYLV